MTKRITFLHTADLHIGAPVRGFCNLTEEWQARLQEAIPAAFDRIVDLAVSRAVDFVVVAGDAFDITKPSYGDYCRFFAGLARLGEAGIPTYLVAGNHDPFATWGKDVELLPPSAHLLGTDGPSYVLHRRDAEPLCLIGARGYRNQAWPVDESIAEGISRERAVAALRADEPNADAAPFTVGIVHTGLDLDQSKAYCDPRRLMQADVDYWACGHLHKRLVKPSEESPRIVFPGCIQGRDLKESGKRGCYLVSMEESDGRAPRAVLEFVPTADVTFHTLRLDVSSCLTLADVSQLVVSQLFLESGRDQCEQMVVRVMLEGATDLHAFLASPDVLSDLRRRINDAYPKFFCDVLVDRTVSRRDRDAARRGATFAGQLLRVADQQSARSEETINYVQSELVKRGIDVPASLVRRIDEYGFEAESLVMDLLEEESL